MFPPITSSIDPSAAPATLAAESSALPAESSASPGIFRIAPPLTVSDSELDRGLEILDVALSKAAC